MDDAGAKIFIISDLIRQGRAFSATSSLSASSRRPVHWGPRNNDDKPSSRSQNLKPDFEFLTPLNYPVSLTGTLTLPVQGNAYGCPYGRSSGCFRFCDGTCNICCDVLDFNVAMLQKRINVVSFNFIPFKHGGGFLEIIKWEVLRCDGGSISFPLCLSASTLTEDYSKAKYHVHGRIESVSPVSLVPCRMGASGNSGDTMNLRGFLMKFLGCECKLCTAKDKVMTLLENTGENSQGHVFAKDLFLYFCGHASSWHAAMTKMVGKTVVISGLKKKLIYIGKDVTEMMLVTTEKSVLHLCGMSMKFTVDRRMADKDNGECCDYTGLVKGVYMEGMVVELDREVWLLLTDHQLLVSHGLRVGAMVSVKNAHLISAEFSWTKVIVLGACFRTSLVVESFSPFVTGCHAFSQTLGFLGRLITSLTFSARLWLLLTASCFQKKFVGLLSEKEIRGMKNVLPDGRLIADGGVFIEYCKHASCGFGAELCHTNLKLVVPFSLLICYCEAIWADLLLESMTTDEVSKPSNRSSSVYFERGSYGQLIRRLISSHDIGITLLGNLMISPCGWLQLVDGSYSLNVLVPDLPASWNSSSIYEVNEYEVILTGVHQQGGPARRLDDAPFSCRSIFNSFPEKNRRMEFDIFVHFHWSKVTCKSLSAHSSDMLKNECEELRSGTFHLLRIVHKFPPCQKYLGGFITLPSMLVEAILLPWDLSVSGKDVVECMSDIAVDYLEETSGNVSNNWGYVPCKRKNSTKSSSTTPSAVEGDDRGLCSQLNSQKLPCLVTFRGLNAGHTGCLTKIGPPKNNVRNGRGLTSSHKVWLEFKATDVVKFKILNIGGYYISKYQEEDPLLKHFGRAINRKVLLTSENTFWSISFDIGGDLFENISSSCVTRNDNIQGKEIVEAFCGHSPASSSDCCLHVSADIADSFKTDLLELELSLSKQAISLGEGLSDSTSPQEMVYPPLSSKLCTAYLFPEGDLISISGDVTAVEIFNHGSGNLYPTYERLSHHQQSDLFFGALSSVIHVLTGNNIVHLSGSLRKQSCPVGLGPGVNATFYRVLRLRGSGLMLTPVSYIKINSLRMSTDPCIVKQTNTWFSSYSSFSSEIVSSGFISNLAECSSSSTTQLRGRVIALHILIMEKTCMASNGADLRFDGCQTPLISIPIAGFLVEDGTSSCLCWCNAERASTLLRLYEKIPQTAFESRNWTLKWVKNDSNTHQSSACYLHKILTQHHRITVRNFGSMLDSPCQDLVISVASNDILRNSDEDLLKYIIFNACSDKDWIIEGTIMDLDAAQQLEKQLCLKEDTELEGIQHVWVTEVSCVKLHLEARKICNELLGSFLDSRCS